MLTWVSVILGTAFTISELNRVSQYLLNVKKIQNMGRTFWNLYGS